MKIKIGVEIECIYNPRLIEMYPGEYHDGNPIGGLANWIVEYDSSLSTSSAMGFNGNTAEIISSVIMGKESFFREIKKFMDFFSQNGKNELKKVLHFNKTCGSHIHIGIIRKPHMFYKKVSNNCLIKTRNKFLRDIGKNQIISTSARKNIIDNYFRTFSRKSWQDHNRENISFEKNYEFNFYSERQGKGIEWRGLNMIGIKTWEEFYEFWKIVYNCVEYLVKISNKWKDNNRWTLRPKTEKLFKKYLLDKRIEKYTIYEDPNRPEYQLTTATGEVFQEDEPETNPLIERTRRTMEDVALETE
ncbi:MAG: hypothetical protein IH948_00115 [Bacteroidetes bacterium]|nr:hypothetical protein [Bacteroidota bacterium]